MDDFIYTIDSGSDSEKSDAEAPLSPSRAQDNGNAQSSASSKTIRKKSKRTVTKVAGGLSDEDDNNQGDVLDPDFEFDLGGGYLQTEEDLWGPQASSSKTTPFSVDDIIARRRKSRGEVALPSRQLKRKRDEVAGGSAEEDDPLQSDEDINESDTAEEFGAGANDSDEEEESDVVDGDFSRDSDATNLSEESEQEEDGESEDDDNVSVASTSSSIHSASSTSSQKAAKEAFFAPANPRTKSSRDQNDEIEVTFASMNISRPLLRALTALEFLNPTPIQKAAIPIALAGHDVLGSAVTGSGKTGAFLIPTLERLLFREKKRVNNKGKSAAVGGEIRVLVLVPTRELAVQVAEVGRKLARFTDINFGVVVGGISPKQQASVLHSRPDVLIATPGRLIDHLTNTPNFNLSSLDVLILDEADRMLSDGFAAELAEIIRQLPTGQGGGGRQTMLFSATMSDDIQRLVGLSMHQPVRLFVTPKKGVLSKRLEQEFIRVKREAERQALLIALCEKLGGKTGDNGGTLVFFRSKKLCHQMRVVFGVLGMMAAELHGDLSQEQRLQALDRFKSGDAPYLLATDVASRGLDIKGMKTVINYDMPGTIELYLHRVGRTARAGERGRAISLVGEPDRAMLKAVLKRSASSHGVPDDESSLPLDDSGIKHRLMPDEIVKDTLARLEEMKDEVTEVLKEEKLEKEIRRAEMEVTKGQNMLEHADEIFARPKKTWFASEKQKTSAQDVSKAEYTASFPEAKDLKSKDGTAPKRDRFSGLNRKAKRRKMAVEADKEFAKDQNAGQGAIKASIRSAKKSQRPGKIGEDRPESKFSSRSKGGAGKKSKSKTPSLTKSKGSMFSKEAGQKSSVKGAFNEGMRAKKGDGGIIGGKGGKPKSKPAHRKGGRN